MTPEQTIHSVIIYTTHHRIEGLMTLIKDERFSDKLNILDKKFESLSQAKVFSIQDGRLLHESPFLAVNKEQITLFIPVENE